MLSNQISSLDDEDNSDTELISFSKSDNYTSNNFKYNRKTYLPVGYEILENRTGIKAPKFKYDTESIIKIDNLIISTICYKPNGNKWKYAGDKGWRILWIVINTYDKYFKLFLDKHDLSKELNIKSGNNEYFIKQDLNELMCITRIFPSHSIFKINIIKNDDKSIKKYEKKYNKKVEKFNDNIKSKRIMKLGSVHLGKIEQLKEIINYTIISKKVL